MKKLLIGAIVGGLLLFIWQSLSWTVFDLHAKGHIHTDNQDAILSMLSTSLPGEGAYFLPMPKPGSSEAEQQAVIEQAMGKPWAQIYYHQSLNLDMGINIVRGLLVTIVLMGLFCWIIGKIAAPKMGTVFLASLFAGLIVFLNGVYTMHIWYPIFDLMEHFVDSIISWGLAGIWLGWWYARK